MNFERNRYTDQHRYGWNYAPIFDLAEEALRALGDLAEFDHRQTSFLPTLTKTLAQKATQSAVINIFALGGRVG